MNSIFVAKIRILVAKVGILLLANAILSPIADPWIAEREPRMDELFGRTVKLDEQFMAKLSSEIGPDDALLGKVRARYTTAQALEFIGIPFSPTGLPSVEYATTVRFAPSDLPSDLHGFSFEWLR